MKKLLSLLVSVLLVLMSTVYAFAVETEDVIVTAEPDIQILDDKITLKDDQVMYTTYNISKNHQWGIYLSNDSDSGESITRLFRDCINKPQIINTEKGSTYEIYTAGAGMSGSQTADFATTGGEYVKVRVKLSALSDYFNADGSRTMKDHSYRFGDVEVVGDDEYSACLAIISGGAVNGVAPDKNGFVEIYVCTDINASTRYFTNFSWEINRENGGVSFGGGGGTNGASIYGLKVGSVDGSFGVYIKDATYVQMYATKLKDFDEVQKFRGDVDRDGIVNIVDATKIQLYVAGYKF